MQNDERQLTVFIILLLNKLYGLVELKSDFLLSLNVEHESNFGSSGHVWWNFFAHVDRAEGRV